MKAVLNKWVIGKMQSKKWSMRELGRRTGIDHGHISRVLSDKQEAGLDFYLTIAQAFDAVSEMLRTAGVLPSVTNDDEMTFSELLTIVKKLTPDEREEVVRYAFYRLWTQGGGSVANEENDAASDGEITKAQGPA
jgi:transcriptional regulator with XRE-family HTH domain